MAFKGRHKLTDRFVSTAPPGRYSDDSVRELFLLVTPEGGRFWRLRFRFKGKDRLSGLGGDAGAKSQYPDVGVALARERARAYLDDIRAGVDPVAKRRELRRAAPSKGKRSNGRAHSNISHAAITPTSARAFAMQNTVSNGSRVSRRCSKPSGRDRSTVSRRATQSTR